MRSRLTSPSRPRMIAIAIAIGASALLVAQAAVASVTWTVQATADGPGGPVLLDQLLPGDRISLDITVRSTEGLFGFSGSVNDYDPTVVGLDASASAVSPTIFNELCIPTLCVGGLMNVVTVPIAQTSVPSVGVEVDLFAGISSAASAGSGAEDLGVVTGLVGDPQFRVVFTALQPGSTVLRVGTYLEYQDLALVAGGTGAFSENVEIPIVVLPEPTVATLLGLGLAGLAARRRR